MYQSKKRLFTLLELLISIALTVVILSTLMYFYRQTSIINARMDVAQNEAFKFLYIQNRLSNTIQKSEKVFDFYFFSSPDVGGLYKGNSPSLVFSFDNCVKLDKQMAYIAIGRLFLDNDGNFTLATWPAPKRWVENEPVPMRKEVLLEGVKSLKFKFFGKVDEDTPLDWIDDWNQETGKLPIMVKVMLTLEEGDDLEYTFFLPNTEEPITYRQ